MIRLVLTPDERGERLGDAASQCSESVDGFDIRYCEDVVTSYLRWQAGTIVNESRHYRAQGMTSPFQGTVAIFHLKGFGKTRDEAVTMAKRRGR